MVLYIDSDAAYLVLPNAKSHIAGYYYLTSIPPTPDQAWTLNAPVLVMCKTLWYVYSLAAKAKIVGVFTNA